MCELNKNKMLLSVLLILAYGFLQASDYRVVESEGFSMLLADISLQLDDAGNLDRKKLLVSGSILNDFEKKYTFNAEELSLSAPSNLHKALHVLYNGQEFDVSKYYLDNTQYRGANQVELLRALAICNKHEALDHLLNRPSMDGYKKDKFGMTPLHYAALLGHAKCVDVLLKSFRPSNNSHKVKLYEQDNAGNTPLHLALYAGHSETVQKLTEEEVEIEQKDKLKKKVKVFSVSTFKNFLRKKNKSGETPLDMAVSMGSVDNRKSFACEIVEKYYKENNRNEFKSIINIKDSKGKTAFDCALESHKVKSNHKFIDILRRAGAEATIDRDKIVDTSMPAKSSTSSPPQQPQPSFIRSYKPWAAMGAVLAVGCVAANYLAAWFAR